MSTFLYRVRFIILFISILNFMSRKGHAFTIVSPIISDAKKSRSRLCSLPPVPNLLPPVPNIFAEGKDHLILAGKVLPVLTKLLITPKDAQNILQILQQDTDWRELALLCSLSFGLTPFMRVLYRLHIKRIFFWFAPDNFYKSKTYHVTNHISQGFKIASGVYLLDILSNILISLGVSMVWVQGLSKNVAAVAYLLWELARFKGIKEFILLKLFKRENVFVFYNRFVNYVLYIITAVQIMDILTVSYGKAVSTVFAFGGVGTLVFSLASKELAEHFLSGVSLSLTEKFAPGDSIICGDGTKGTVKALGLFHTVIQGNDEIVVKVPNTLLDNQKVFNLSKGNTSQVMQRIYFSYNDIDKIPFLVSEIKSEIKSSCPKLIPHPFRVHWSEYAENYLVVTVDARFDIKPVGDAYHDTRQIVLEAIARATKRCGVKFYSK